jgi:RNA polymerase sigma-70 factor (ECF subfamily)
VLVNGELGMLIPDLPADGDHKAVSRRVTVFEIADGRVTRIYDMANPDKLTRLTF